MPSPFGRPLPRSEEDIDHMDRAAVALGQTQFVKFQFRRCTIEYNAATDTTYAAVWIAVDTWSAGSWLGHITLAKVRGGVGLRPPRRA